MAIIGLFESVRDIRVKPEGTSITSGQQNGFAQYAISILETNLADPGLGTVTDSFAGYNTIGVGLTGQTVGSTSLRGAFPNGVTVSLRFGNSGAQFIPEAVLCTGYGKLEIEYTVDVVEI